MKDMAGNAIEVGDYVTDSRGHLFRIQETPRTVQANRVAYAQEVRWTRGGLAETRGPTAARLYTAVKVTPAAGVDYKALYQEAYNKHGRAVTEAELKDHKTRVSNAGLGGKW